MPHPSGTGIHFDVMQERLSNENVRQLGNELRPGLPICLFFWWAEQGQLPGNDLIPADLAHFVLAHLCGSSPTTEATNGMANGLLHVETLEWHKDVIHKLGLPQLRLPEVRPHGDVVAWLPFGDRKIPCYPAIGDYQCALLGSLIHDQEPSLNISTGSQVSLLKAKAEFGDFQTRPFFDGQYSNTITHIPTGRALNSLMKLFSELATAHDVPVDKPWSYIAQQVATIAVTELKVNLSFYASACGDKGAITDI
jgi:sugar (pentulose or hexulose) kinase